MQQNWNDDTTISNAIEYNSQPGTTSGGQVQEFMLHEQSSRDYGSHEYITHEYASRDDIAREPVPYDTSGFDGLRPSYLEKVTSYPMRRRSQKSAWVAVTVIAF